MEGLSAVLGLVDRFADEPDLHDFLTVCFSATIRRASNADNQTMKTYVSHTHVKKLEDPRELFRATLLDYANRIRTYATLRHSSSQTTVVSDLDARTLATDWLERGLPQVDLAVTSPPYIKSVDYIYNQMAELFLIGDRWGLEDQKAQNAFKMLYMGTERVTTAATEPLALGAQLSEVAAYISKIGAKDPKLALVASKYFSDTHHFLDLLKGVRSAQSRSPELFAQFAPIYAMSGRVRSDTESLRLGFGSGRR